MDFSFFVRAFFAAGGSDDDEEDELEAAAAAAVELKEAEDDDALEDEPEIVLLDSPILLLIFVPTFSMEDVGIRELLEVVSSPSESDELAATLFVEEGRLLPKEKRGQCSS